MVSTKCTSLLVAVALIIGFSACTEETEDTLHADVQGTWLYVEGSTTYSAGLLLGLSGHADIVDTVTVIETVTSLFAASELSYLADSTGSLHKQVVQTETTDSASLAAILNDYVGQQLQKEFTYTAGKSNIAMKMGSQTFNFTVLEINETSLKVSMPLADITGWMTNLLGDRVSGITNASVFVTIGSLAATLGVYASPTVTMVFSRHLL